jgi:hypothetical protein
LLSSFSVDSDALNPITSLIVQPIRREYPLGGIFDPADVEVYAVYIDGSTRAIPLDEVDITGTDVFDTPGGKTITVEYRTKIAKFAVFVRSDAVSGGGGEGPPSSGTGGASIDLVITWSD